jgi:phage tail-like protein
MTDPFETFKFRVTVDGLPFASVAKVTALKRTTGVIEHREGVDPSSSRKEPGPTRYEAITLTRGVTADRAFEQWANQVYKLNGQPNLAQFRKEMVIELLDAAGTPLLTYQVHRCWISEYVALPDLDADTDAVAFESITIENEGWERQG